MAELIAEAGASFASVGYDLEVYAADKTESGYYEFIAGEMGKALKMLAGMRDEATTLQFLSKSPALIEGIAHVRAWFFERHVGMLKNGKTAEVQDEAAAFFLLDAAADAARAHYAKTQKLEGAALEGVRMLSMGLGAKGDPVGIRNNISAHANLWLAVVKHAAAGQRAATGKKMQQLSKKTAGSRPAVQANKPASDPARVLPGLGFQVLSPIASGAFSTILRCKPNGSDVEVAIKSFDLAKCSKDPIVREARDSELGVLARLKDHPLHPHIANLLGVLGDAIKAPHCHAILEYASGGSLKRHLESLKKSTPSGAGMAAGVKGVGGVSGAMAPALAARGAAQLASALAHLHGLEIGHGDVKPANVLLLRPIAEKFGIDEGGLASVHLKLCDFGFACVCGDVKLKSYCGTPSYLAPELVTKAEAAKGYLGRPVDVWALGCVVYEMLHGKAAFAAQEAFQLETKIRAGNHGGFDAGVPTGAKALVSALLATDPKQRASAADALEQKWLKETGGDVEGVAAGATSAAATGGAATGGAAGGAAAGVGGEEKKEQEAGLLGGMMGWFGGVSA